MTDQPPPEPAAEQSGIARHSVAMAAGALASRVTGFVRTAALGAVLGAGLVGDAYAVATMLPGIFYEVLLGGTLAAVLVPVLVRARDDDDRGHAYIQRLLTLGVLVFAVATALVVAAVPAVVAVLTGSHSSSPSQGLVTAWSYLALPTIFFYGLGALLTAVLNAHDRFAMPTWAALFNNLILIAGAAVFLALPSPARLEPGTITPAQIWVIGGATLLGVAVQAAVLWPAVRRTGLRWRWRFDLRALRLSHLGRLTGWLLCYIAVSQVAVLVVIALVKAAGDRNAPGVFIYSNGWLMLMMGYGVAALPIITALQPRIAATADDQADTIRRYTTGTRMIIIVLAPITVAFVALGQPIAVTLFAWHRYTHAQAVDTGSVIAVAGICLIPYALSQAQTFAFFALSDARTPAILNIPIVALRIALYVVAFWVVPAGQVAVAAMAANGVSYLAASLGGWWLLRRRGVRSTAHATTMAKVTAAAATAAVATAATSFVVGNWLPSNKLAAVTETAMAGAVLLVAYLVAAAALRLSEARQLLTAALRKLPTRAG